MLNLAPRPACDGSRECQEKWVVSRHSSGSIEAGPTLRLSFTRILRCPPPRSGPLTVSTPVSPPLSGPVTFDAPPLPRPSDLYVLHTLSQGLVRVTDLPVSTVLGSLARLSLHAVKFPSFQANEQRGRRRAGGHSTGDSSQATPHSIGPSSTSPTLLRKKMELTAGHSGLLVDVAVRAAALAAPNRWGNAREFRESDPAHILFAELPKLGMIKGHGRAKRRGGGGRYRLSAPKDTRFTLPPTFSHPRPDLFTVVLIYGLNTHVAFDSAAFPQLLLQNGVRGCEGSGRTGVSARVWSIPATVRALLPDVLLTKLHPTRQLDICFFPTQRLGVHLSNRHIPTKKMGILILGGRSPWLETLGGGFTESCQPNSQTLDTPVQYEVSVNQNLKN
eukprot:m.319924 g.319924  ORF g.319924 m.319924 type:complete len:389 (-) comp16448_c0_seq21:1351-2517(-)